MSALAPTLQSFFADYLSRQRAASGHTIASYRDTFRLLLGYVQQQTGVRPSDVDIALLDAKLVGAFLMMLEQNRGNSTRTRNARLAAIHSLFSHAALRHPEHAELIAQVLAIPFKHGKQTVVSYLDDAEVQTLLAIPDRATWSGRRDHLLLLLMVTTGMRVSEVTSLARADVSTNHRFACVSCTGKGRKQARHTARPPHGRGTESMARRKHRRAGPTAVHRTGHKPSPQPRRSRTADPTARRGSDRDLPDAGHQARHASRPAPHLRHADAGRRSRGRRRLTVPRPRVAGIHPPLHPCRPCPQAARPRPHRPAQDEEGPLPADRRPPRLPRSPVVMPNYPARPPPRRAPSPEHRDNRNIGIVVVIPTSA